jgi:predicted secreted acid phosphatase
MEHKKGEGDRNMRAVVFDLDGTLINNKHRQSCLTDPPDWDIFHKDMEKDTPHLPTAELCQQFHRHPGLRIIYITSRSTSYIKRTADWLEQNNMPPGDIYHRNDNDHRPAAVVKLELLEEIKTDGHNIIMLFDDDSTVVLAARGAGYAVAHVDFGGG